MKSEKKWKKQKEIGRRKNRMYSVMYSIYAEYRSKILRGPRNKVKLSPRLIRSFYFFLQSPMEGPISSPRSPKFTNPDRHVPSQNSMKTESLHHIKSHCQNLSHPSNVTHSSEPLLWPLGAPWWPSQPFPAVAGPSGSCVLAGTPTVTGSVSYCLHSSSCIRILVGGLKSASIT